MKVSRGSATLLTNLGTLHTDQGRHGEAESLYKRSLAIREKALPPDHRDIGSLLSFLARVYDSQGKLGLAEPLYCPTSAPVRQN